MLRSIPMLIVGLLVGSGLATIATVGLAKQKPSEAQVKHDCPCGPNCTCPDCQCNQKKAGPFVTQFVSNIGEIGDPPATPPAKVDPPKATAPQPGTGVPATAGSGCVGQPMVMYRAQGCSGGFATGYSAGCSGGFAQSYGAGCAGAQAAAGCSGGGRQFGRPIQNIRNRRGSHASSGAYATTTYSYEAPATYSYVVDAPVQTVAAPAAPVRRFLGYRRVCNGTTCYDVPCYSD